MEYLFENWIPVAVTILLCILFTFLIKFKNRKYIFPSGPFGLPVIGNALSLVRTPLHLKLSEWADEFGDIYTMHLGPRAAVVVNDMAAMKEIFSIFPASTGKFGNEFFEMPFRGTYGFVTHAGHAWQEQRQFCVKNLRTFGFGKGSTMEPMMMDEVKDFANWLKVEGENGKPVLTLTMLQKATFNTLWTLITGHKFPQGDSRFAKLMDNWMDAVQKATNSGLAFMPWLKHFAPRLSGFEMADKAALNINQFVWENFREHEKDFVEGSPRDLIDSYLEQISKETDPASCFYGENGWRHCVASVVALFIGGGETTATTLNWLIFYLCCDQQAQRKLQEEIDRVIGRDREPTLLDKPKMPYIEAVILETMRKSSFLPIGLIHEFTEDTRFRNYVVPKGVMLLTNLYHAHHNRKVWGDPENFRPERFLTGDKTIKENVIAFSVGRRQCLGEGLARDAMFLFVAKLFQKFHFSTDPSITDKEYLEPDMGYCLKSKDLPVVVKSRDG